MMRSRYGRTIALIGASSALILSYKSEIAKSLVQYSEPLFYGVLILMLLGGAYKMSKTNDRMYNFKK